MCSIPILAPPVGRIKNTYYINEICTGRDDDILSNKLLEYDSAILDFPIPYSLNVYISSLIAHGFLL
jgi:hypothetical protein